MFPPRTHTSRIDLTPGLRVFHTDSHFYPTYLPLVSSNYNPLASLLFRLWFCHIFLRRTQKNDWFWVQIYFASFFECASKKGSGRSQYVSDFKSEKSVGLLRSSSFQRFFQILNPMHIDRVTIRFLVDRKIRKMMQKMSAKNIFLSAPQTNEAK